MDDDIVTRLREMATDCARYSTHYDGCDQWHIECAALHACDEIERLRAEVRRVRLGHITTLGELQVASEEIERLRADLEEAYDACRYALADSPRWRENAATVVAEWEARNE